ncbi:MAG: DUF4923 family protein, partial [Bacteroidales bacterium]|nr:DUF4923 family protein [Bacteroidales bacterium]
KTLKILLLTAALILTAGIAMAQNNNDKDAEPPKDPIIGSWKYAATTLHPESAEKVKKELNSPERLQKKMGSSLLKVGFRAGSTLVFKEDGTFYQRISGKNYEGTYTCSSDHKNLELTFNHTGETISMEMKFNEKEFHLTVPADKFMNFVNVAETKANSETLLFVLCLVTMFEDTKLMMKYVK